MPYGREDNTCLVKTCAGLVSTVTVTQAVRDILSPYSEYSSQGPSTLCFLTSFAWGMWFYCGSMLSRSILISYRSFHLICDIIGQGDYPYNTGQEIETQRD